MKFGFCAPLEYAEAIAAIGYDYIEPPLVSTLEPELDPEGSLATVQDTLANSHIGADAFNIFLPGSLKVTGPDVDPIRQVIYLKSAISRVSNVGGKVIVFGSGGARNIPDAFPKERAFSQVVSFLNLVAPIAKENAITIAIEPLNKGECNFINSVDEGMELVKALDHPNIAVLSDLYHVDTEKQSYSETSNAGSKLAHVHVAGAVGRRIPILDDVDFLAGYFGVLKAMAYDKRISIEGISQNLTEDAKLGLEVLNRAWEIA